MKAPAVMRLANASVLARLTTWTLFIGRPLEEALVRRTRRRGRRLGGRGGRGGRGAREAGGAHQQVAAAPARGGDARLDQPEAVGHLDRRLPGADGALRGLGGAREAGA